MSENGEKPPANQDRVPKALIIWLTVLGLIVLLYSFTGQTAAHIEEYTVLELQQALDAGNVIEGQIKSNPAGGRNYYNITAKLKGDTSEKDKTVRADAYLTDDSLAALQQSGKFKDKPASTLLEGFLLNIIPVLLIIGLLYFLFLRQIRSAGRGAMSFGKSRAKMLTRDRDKVLFKDVAGCEEAKEEVAEVVDFLKDPKKFQKIGGRIPKGVLLVGPPGTGKTLIARAVAGEAEVPFFSISGSDFVEMFVGVGAARVRDMFEQGRKNAPCIVFIDEIDAVGRQRGAGLGGGNDEREQTLNSLLVEMDGFDGHEGVIIMAATNRPDVLDGALMRPGRFDRQVMIDLPDLMGREEILRVHAKKIKLEENVDLAVIARATPGFSGADLANLLNESALLAARYNKKMVQQQDIDEARDKIAYGRERRKLMDDEDKKMTAYHEAGHALVQAIIDDGKLPLHKVTIIPRGRALGMTMFMPKKDMLGQSRKQLINQICTMMAGRIGEEVATGDYSNGAAGDIKQATNLARHMVCDWGMSDLGPVALGENQEHLFLAREITRSQNYSDETARKIDAAIRELIDAQYKRAEQLISEHKDALEKIADALLEHETIEGKHVHEIIEHGEIKSPVVHAFTPPPKHEENKEAPSKNTKVEEEEEDLPPGAEPAGAPA